MLLDLDKRGVDAVTDESRYAQIRAVNLPPSRREWWWVFLPTAIFGGIFIWLLLTQFLPNWKTPQTAIPLMANQAVPVVLPSSKILLHYENT